MAKSKYENVSNKDLVNDAVQRKVIVDASVIWEGENLKVPTREKLIELLEKNDNANEANPNNPITDSNIYAVNEKIISSPTGFSAKIDGQHIMVVPNLYDMGFDSQNQKVSVLKQPGFVLVDGIRTASGMFENLTDKQLFELASAGVIKMTAEQEKAFRLKFYNIKDKK